MFVEPQHQSNTWALARGSADYRPNGAPAYFLGRPASIWIGIHPHGRRGDGPGRAGAVAAGAFDTGQVLGAEPRSQASSRA